MKCPKCGIELRKNARFCDACGTPLNVKQTKPADSGIDRRRAFEDLESYGRKVQRANETAYQKGIPFRQNESAEPCREEAPRQPFTEDLSRSIVPPITYAEENDRREAPYRPYPEEAPYRPYSEDDGYPDDTPRRPYPADDRADNRVDYHPHKSPKKGKKALIISLIALLLVIAIAGGVIFFVNRNSVSAAELQEAKDQYLPPSKAVTIDTSLDDPSNDDIRFTYDDRARILTCTYKANEKTYDQSYTYDDDEKQVHIETTYKKQRIHSTAITYSRIQSPNRFEDVDGYYVRLDDESLNGVTAATEALTEAPTEAELIDQDISEFPQLEAFMNYYIMWGPEEYDSRHVSENEQNILMSVANFYSCVNPEIYPGSGITTYPAEAARQMWPWDSKGLELAAFDKTEADWICKNIFNISDADIETLYNDQYNQQNMFADDNFYYTIYGGKGSVVSTKLKSVKTDDRFYYVVCDVYVGGVLQDKGTYSVMELKNIDGSEYWSMYYISATVPDAITPFDTAG